MDGPYVTLTASFLNCMLPKDTTFVYSFSCLKSVSKKKFSSDIVETTKAGAADLNKWNFLEGSTEFVFCTVGGFRWSGLYDENSNTILIGLL
jgi:hypothetical protein